MIPPDFPPGISTQKSDNRFLGVLIGVAVGVLCELGGYLLMRGEQQQFGVVVFILVPFITGFFIAIFTPSGSRILACSAGALLLTLSILILIGLEGYICCLMAAPLLAAGIGLGAWLGTAFNNRQTGQKVPPKIRIFLLIGAAFFLVGAKGLEQPFIETPRYETFEQRITVPASPAKAWDLIKAMNRLDAPKPFLLKLGLPIPQSCDVDKEAVGGKRICHFNSGIIAQEITEWNPPASMKFKITDCTLPGRHWLKFIEAGYDFIPDGDKTIVVRKTTISSRLFPRWYWRNFESWGVQSEHEYVLADLKHRAELESK